MVDQKAVKDALRQHQIELPSWAFGNSGTRFKVFAQPGVPRNPVEKADDAAQVHKYTGVAPSMAVHIPWDKVDDYEALSAHAKGNGIRIGTVNANVFQDDDYKLGSVCNPDPKSRAKALAHLLDCVDIMDATGSRDLKLWFADGTNYPGQDDIAARQDRLAEALAAVYARLGPGQRMLLEYKLFEPSFYTTDVPDWGTALLHCTALGDKAQVVVDTGHHAPGVNIEFIVALLLKAGKLGGFDFNSRFYADDDLMVGAADPFQLFRIMHEVVKAGGLYPGQSAGITASNAAAGTHAGTASGRAAGTPAGITASGAAAPGGGAGIAFMLDQCHNIEPKIPAQIRSVMNVQEAVAKALLVDTEALRAAQLTGDVLAANAALMDAYNTDVRPLLAQLRAEMGLAPDPVAAYLASGYAGKIVSERVGGAAAGWGA
jgi:L-rhamnose isomerase / sugar isomerase